MIWRMLRIDYIIVYNCWSMEKILSLAEEPEWDGVMTRPINVLVNVGLWDMEQNGLLTREGDSRDRVNG